MIRTGIGYDIHRFAAGRRLILGGVEIPSPEGLDGHSDADVVCHALADALLGAVADGDIGQHFPNTDPAWKNADSVELLRAVVGRVKAKGFHVVNVDAVITAEKPKVMPFAQRMRERLAPVLEVTLDDVSIKATTMEGLGAIGRGEGIAGMAVATVERDESRIQKSGSRRKTETI
ncbi:MAG: 2-C-methyl-D-erythritol 2,4-cyclodiphosphate synthase [bacterium]